MNNSSDLLDHTSFLVFGAARSGLAAARLLHRLGKTVAVYDEAPAEKTRAARAEMEALRIPFLDGIDAESFPEWHSDGSDAVGGMWEVLVLSPGIRTDHPLAVLAEERGCIVRGEIEIGFRVCPAPLAAITGTNGKTTVTHLAAHLFKQAGRTAPVAGNVGIPLCAVAADPALRDPGAVVVCEVSSYQLESIESFRPRAACVLNITPDHLDRYGTMAHYTEAKHRITENQQPGDFLVLNADDRTCLSFSARTAANLRLFSLERPVQAGAFVEDGWVHLASPGRAPLPLLPCGDIPLPGLHNVANVLAALCLGDVLGLDPAGMAAAVRTFQAVPHRIQKIATLDGVDYYNDSKATNLDSLGKALASFDRPIVLIAGGRDKGAPWQRLNPLVQDHVKGLVLIGEAAPIGRAAWAPIVPRTEDAADMDEAVRRARHLAAPGDVVLLSPACASFDMYADFEARGADFTRIVRGLAAQPEPNP